MKLEWHRDPNVFETLHAEWNGLLARSITRVPFLRAEYQRAWWQHRGGGEWPEAELAVVTARDEAGELIGVAPLFAAPDAQKRRALMLVGSHAISDYLDLIVAPPDLEAFAAALLERLAAPDAAGWEVLDLYNLPAASPARAALASAASARGWSAAEQPLEQTPIIHLPDNWDAYLAMMDKKERHELKRKIRRAEGGEDKIEWRFTGAEMAGTFLDLMAQDAARARFLTPAMRDQFQAIVKAAGEQGWLKLAFLEVNGAPAAAYLNFDFENQVWVYNSALDQRFGALSAGWVLLGKLLQWAIDNRRATFDFMRGDEDYKFRFGAVGEKVYRLQMSPVLSPAELAGALAPQPDEAETLPRGG